MYILRMFVSNGIPIISIRYVEADRETWPLVKASQLGALFACALIYKSSNDGWRLFFRQQPFFTRSFIPTNPRGNKPKEETAYK